MLRNKVHFPGESVGREFNQLSGEEADLVSKALYTGHAVFSEDGVSLTETNNPRFSSQVDALNLPQNLPQNTD